MCVFSLSILKNRLQFTFLSKKNPKLWIYKCKIGFYKCKINYYKCKIKFYKCKNDMLNQIITSYAQKLGYKWHSLVKNPKLWIYKCKINFYKCKLTCVKKLCHDIHSRSEICWKKPKYPKKWIFGATPT